MACSDVQTIQAGNGTKTLFSFDFPYIFKSEIHVYFWNAVTKEYDEKLTTDATYPWRITDANPTIVEFTGTAPPSPATPVDPNETAVDNVKIRRITKVDDIRALFNPGSAIRSDDLNKNFEQLRYAIQEANCQGIPDIVYQYLEDYYWDRYDNTLYDGDTWVSDDTKIATSEAIDDRVDSKIDDAITNDIGTDGTGITVTDDGDGTITLGLADNSIDFDKIKDVDQIRLSDQVDDPDVEGSDNNMFTAQALTRRFNNYYQNTTPGTTAGIGVGQVWVDPNDDLTLSVWSGSAWVGITSGGTFTNQPKVVYVDATSGSDSNDGHRISRPKQTIKAAVEQINADSTYGDGSVVMVAAGVYQEAAPIQIQKKNVSIIGQALRSCVVHPTVATQGDHATGNHALFELNSGSFIQNLTLTGMKANNSGSNTVDSDLPSNQGWNFKFYSGATITKSPYIQNCTNFSDSEIDNSSLNPNNPAGGAAGDLDSAPTGGGLLVDGSVLSSTSPLRSMVCDSYTHVGLNGPGILVTNNGYCQATSSYAFFNKYHIKTLNGGQANLAASTTDFGDQALVADGKSTSAIFTSNVDGAASDGAISFNINEPTAAAGWFGNTERPATNMLVEVNSVIYPILSATANTDTEGGSGWTVTISRPNSANRSENLGLNGAVADDAAVSFYLRSMIASSGHTMEYVGSGTDYRALPENGGVPDESKQITESNNGKIWTAITDHNGKFKIGGNQTDDPIFEVDQQLGFVTIPEGSIAFNLLSDTTPQLGGNLDVNGNTITSTSNGNVVIDPNGTGTVDVSSSRITSVSDPTGAQDAATKAYVDSTLQGVVEDTTPQLGGDLDVNGNEIISVSNGDIPINPNGTGVVVIGGTSSVPVAAGNLKLQIQGTTTSTSRMSLQRVSNDTNGPGIHLAKARGSSFTAPQADDQIGIIAFNAADGNDYTHQAANIQCHLDGTPGENDIPGRLTFRTTPDGSSSPVERLRICNDGVIQVNEAARGSSTNETLIIKGTGNNANILKVYGASDTNTTFVSMGFSSDGSTAYFTGGHNGTGDCNVGIRATQGGTESSDLFIAGGSSQYATFFGGDASNVTGAINSLNVQGGATNRPRLSLLTSDSTVTNGNELGRIDFWGSDGGWHALGYMAIKATQTHSGTQKGSRLTFGTTANGATSPTEQLILDQNGTLTTYGALNIRGDADLADNDVLRFGSGDDVQCYHNGSHFYIDLNNDDDLYIRDLNSNVTGLKFDSSSRALSVLDNGQFGRVDTNTASGISQISAYGRNTATHSSADSWSAITTIYGDYRASTSGAGNEDTAMVYCRHHEQLQNATNYIHNLDVQGKAFHRGHVYAGRGRSSSTGTPTNQYPGEKLVEARGNATSYTQIHGRDTVDTANTFIVYVAGSNRIRFQADGNGRFDGGADIGNADYAEMFEWSDGNPNNEDRRGYSVVLVGEQIRPATSSDDPADILGVISGNPGVLGDAASLNWNQRFLKDEFGTNLTVNNEYLVWNIKGDPVPTSDPEEATAERILVSKLGTDEAKDVPQYAIDDNIRQTMKELVPNPDYDPDLVYVPRKDRKEWAPVGMLGKLTLRVGQPTGANWRKLSDVSDTLERWLVR